MKASHLPVPKVLEILGGVSLLRPTALKARHLDHPEEGPAGARCPAQWEPRPAGWVPASYLVVNHFAFQKLPSGLAGLYKDLTNLSLMGHWRAQLSSEGREGRGGSGVLHLGLAPPW